MVKNLRSTRQLSLWALWSLGVGAVLRLWLVFNDDGIYWPDEIYQSFEPAHRLVFGYGMVAWEFIDGARNWALPGFVAGLLRVCVALGLERPWQYLTVVRCVFALGGVATAYGVFRLAKEHQASFEAQVAGTSLFSLCALAIYFAPRAMSETASALPLTFGLGLLLKPSSRRVDLVMGASLLGLAVMFRLQIALFAVGVLVVLLARRERKAFFWVLATLGVWAFFFGLLDHLTWAGAPDARFSGWFHSALKYLQFNLIEGRSSGWGVSSAFYYLVTMFKAMPGVSLLLVVLSGLAFRKARALLVMTLVFVLIHSAIPHKELRFFFPVLPLFCALAAIGLGELRGRVQQMATRATFAAAAISAALFHTLTFGQLGAYPGRRSVSAYDDYGPVNRMLLAAHEQSDLCGLRVDMAPLAWAGGHSYLHRNVPLYHLGQPPIEAGTFNYLITTTDQPKMPGEIVARDGVNPSMVLVRLGSTGCRPDPDYSWRLP